MTIIPIVRCRRMKTSVAFYTNVLDFECVEHGDDGDPSFSVLMRGGSLLLLSSHGGDGTFGQAIVVLTGGLKTPGNPDAPTEVHEGPINQSWGTRELYVDDPDGNTLRFVEGFGVSPSAERDA